MALSLSLPIRLPRLDQSEIEDPRFDGQRFWAQQKDSEWKRKFLSTGSSMRAATGAGAEGTLPELKRLVLNQQQRLEEQQCQIGDLMQLSPSPRTILPR